MPTAREMSMPTMRACACGLRTVRPQSIPGGVQVARVRELARRLRDGVDAPLLDGRAAERQVGARRHRRLGRRVDGVEDLRVAGAAAEVAGERLAHLVVARVRDAVEQVGGGDDEPRRAEAALHRAGRRERLLHRMERAVAGEPLDRDDLAPVRLRAEHEAGADERRRRAAPSTSRTRPARTRSSSPGSPSRSRRT